MAFEIGTATDYRDLLSKLVTFLTTNATLVGLSQNWTLLKDDTTTNPNRRDVYLRGPGLAGGDNIHVNIRTTHSFADNLAAGWEISGATGFDNGQTFYNQPGVLPTYDVLTNYARTGPTLVLIDDTLKYWFIASGRRFIIVVQVHGKFASAYCGFILPYISPYTYPLMISASTSKTDITNFWEVPTVLTGFFDPVMNRLGPSPSLPLVGDNDPLTAGTSAALYTHNNEWTGIFHKLISNNSTGAGGETNSWGSSGKNVKNYGNGFYPWSNFSWMRGDNAGSGYTADGKIQKGLPVFRTRIANEFDGSMALIPTLIHTFYPVASTGVQGAFDGCYFIPGLGVLPGNTVNDGTYDYLIIDAYGNSFANNYCAIRLS